MTPEEFKKQAIATVRSEIGWQTHIAHKLGVTDRAVRKWMQKERVPNWVEDQLIEDAIVTGRAVQTRDEWVIGQSAPGSNPTFRHYIMHTAPPRFLARLVLTNLSGAPAPAEIPVDTQNGAIHHHETTMGDCLTVCEVTWFDATSTNNQRELVAQAASKAAELVNNNSLQLPGFNND